MSYAAEREYNHAQKVCAVTVEIVRQRRLTAKEAAKIAGTSERNARKILASLCGVLELYWEGGEWILLE